MVGNRLAGEGGRGMSVGLVVGAVLAGIAIAEIILWLEKKDGE